MPLKRGQPRRAATAQSSAINHPPPAPLTTHSAHSSSTTTGSDYAPKSPDLSARPGDDDDMEPLHPQHEQYRGSVSHVSPFTPSAEHAGNPFFTAPPGMPFVHGGGGAAAYASSQGGALGQMQRQMHAPQMNMGVNVGGLQGGYPGGDGFSEVPASGLAQGRSRRAAAGRAAKKFKEEDEEDEEYEDEDEMRIDHHREAAGVMGGAKDESVDGGIEVRTKFPVARIKRIMQADEDVGKVAQVTPVVVSKALELFMISLVTKAAAQAKSRSSKRVTSAHLKQAVLSDEQFDFLNDIVSKVPDAPEPAARGGHHGQGAGDSDEDSGRKRRGGAGGVGGGGRRRRVE